MPNPTMTMVATNDSTTAMRYVVDERWRDRDTPNPDGTPKHWTQLVSVVVMGTYDPVLPDHPIGNSKAWLGPYAPALFSDGEANVVIATMNLMSDTDDWGGTNHPLA